MFKNLLKILAALTGISILAYFLKQKIEVWEIEAAKDEPTPIDPAESAEEHVQQAPKPKPKSDKAPSAKEKKSKSEDEPKNPGSRAQAEANLEAEVKPLLEEEKRKASAKPEETAKKAKDDKSVEAMPPAPAATPTPDTDEAEDEEISSDAPAKDVEIDFSKIGTATAAQKDDLKKIKGIGKALETKLNTVGIYTYQQISKFTPEVEEQVTEAISFFPGRIERDEWVSQAKALLEEKKS